VLSSEFIFLLATEIKPMLYFTYILTKRRTNI